MPSKSKAALLADIATNITTNDAGEIEGSELKGILDDIVASVAVLSHIIKVRAVSVANVTISTGLNPGDVLNGVTLVDGDPVLLPFQTAPADNGIYVVGTTPVRKGVFDSFDSHCGTLVMVGEEPTAYKNTIWLGTSPPGGTLGITAIEFTNQTIPAADEDTVGVSRMSTFTEGREGLLDDVALPPSVLGPFAAFKAYKAATQSITNTTIVAITYVTEAYDHGSAYDTSTSLWTPPAGLVSLKVSARFGPTNLVDGTRFNLGILKNGSADGLNTTVFNTAGGHPNGQTFTTEDESDGNDTYGAFVQQVTGNTCTLDAFGQFAGHRIR